VPANPILAEITRGDLVESFHRGSIAVVDSAGRLVASWGDVDRLVYSRSSAKPFQALATHETGAFEALGLGDTELALHCASHNGETVHEQAVSQWLNKLNLSEADLECGPQTPMWVNWDLLKANKAPDPSKIRNNCSGKHAGFLTACVHQGFDTQGYTDPKHPVQQRVAQVLKEMAGSELTTMPCSTDHCSAPVFAQPQREFARAMAQFADPSGLSSQRAESCVAIFNAMRANPYLIGGRKRIDTVVMSDSSYSGILKIGAEAVHGLAIPEAKLGIAIKIDDGSQRVLGAVVVAVLKKLGLLQGEMGLEMTAMSNPAIHNFAGLHVGEIRATL
jgi:L-asparaginase II